MKRAIDIVCSAAALIVLSPLLAAAYVMIALKLGRPVLFRQVRPGRRKRPFTLLKFRTMSDERNKKGELLSDADRLTGFGRFLRSYSIDELPQLWNILRGDMSLVGPRPLLMTYLDRYTPEEDRRHEIRPGMTGWAQINGRNTLSWEEKFALDVWYVDHQSVFLDLKIMFLTVKRLVTREGISHDGHATMPEFRAASSSSVSNE